MIKVDGLVKQFGTSATAVAGISFDASAHQLLTLLGPSGCGKTTTLRCIAGFIAPDAGRITVGGIDVTNAPPYRRGFGMVFQSYALFPHLSVLENVAFGLRIRGVGQSDIDTRVRRALVLVRLDALRDRMPSQLSGGQQQRVALARAVVYEPKVLLLDEPLSNLDAQLRVQMRSEIRSLQQRLELTAIYVTHDQEEALAISDRIMIMRAGRIEQLASPWEVYHQPATPFVASFVGAANILAGQLSQGRITIPSGFQIAVSPGLTQPDGPVWVIARPEQLSVVEAGVPGTVESVVLLGSAQRLTARLCDGTHVTVDLSEERYPAFRNGEGICIAFNPKRIRVLPRGSDQRDDTPLYQNEATN